MPCFSQFFILRNQSIYPKILEQNDQCQENNNIVGRFRPNLANVTVLIVNISPTFFQVLAGSSLSPSYLCTSKRLQHLTASLSSKLLQLLLMLSHIDHYESVAFLEGIVDYHTSCM